MVRQFANMITSFLIQEKIIHRDDVDIYRYGTEHIIINAVTFTVVGVFAAITNMWLETLFFFVGLVPIRMVAGGYHAKTPRKCNALTFSVYILNMTLIHLMENHMTLLLSYMGYMIILAIIFRFAPVDHKNMVLDDDNLVKSRKGSRIIGVVIIGFSIVISVLFGLNNIFSTSIIMGALTASVSLFIGSILRGGERNEEVRTFE